MVGDMSAVAEPILSSLAREQTEQLLEAAADAIEEEHRLAHQREREEAAAYADAVQKLCEGAAKMSKRLDSLEQKRRDEAREARRQARADIEASLPDPDDPDAPHTANAPGLGFSHEPGSGPSDYSEDDDAATGVLPTVLEKGGPPELGDFPTYDPEELTHPQEPIPQTPTAIGGP
jgi:hypothetical protein